MSEPAATITLGNGRRNTQGERRALDKDNPVTSLVDVLNSLPAKQEGWWSPHSWDSDQRKETNWSQSCGIALDIDYLDAEGEHALVNRVARKALDDAVSAGKVPCSAFHHTPRGARAIFLWRAPVTDAAKQKQAAGCAAKAIEQALKAIGVHVDERGRSGYEVDAKPIRDLARLLFTPNSVVDGHKRKAKLISVETTPFDPDDLIDRFPTTDETPKGPDAPRVEPRNREAHDNFKEARAAYVADHTVDWGPPGQDCPMCATDSHGRGCFGRLPSDPSKWYCWADGHVDRAKVGFLSQSGKGTLGDVLDFHAWQDGVTTAQLLRSKGYLASRNQNTVDESCPVDSEPCEAPDVVEQFYYVKTFQSLVDILMAPHLRDIVLGGELGYSEMELTETIDGRAIRDTDYSRIKLNISRNLRGRPNRGRQRRSSNTMSRSSRRSPCTKHTAVSRIRRMSASSTCPVCPRRSEVPGTSLIWFDARV